MEYEKFTDLGFDKEFQDQPGLYIVSVPGNEHNVQARNLPLGANFSKNLRRGKRLVKFGMAPRSLSTRISDYGTMFPNGFKIEAIFRTRSGRDMDTGYKNVSTLNKYGENITKKLSTNTSHTWKAELNLKAVLEKEGAIYYRNGRKTSQTEWTGLRLDKLKQIMLDQHKKSRDHECLVWFFDANDGTLQNKSIGEKLSFRLATKGFSKKPSPTKGHRTGLRSTATSNLRSTRSSAVVP